MKTEEFVKKYGAAYISSRNNPKCVAYSKLTDAKYRTEYFLAEGEKLSAEALRYADVKEILISTAANEQKAEEFALTANKSGVAVTVLEEQTFGKIATEKSPQGIIAVVNLMHNLHQDDSTDFSEWQKGKRLLMLDELRDPGNLGTIIRTAEALGITGIILCGCADIYNPKTVRASMGSIFRMSIYSTKNGSARVEELKSFSRRVLASALDDKAYTLGSFEPNSTDCVVIGNEGHGISREILSKTTGTFMIPMSGNTESLNAASAAAVILWEYYRTFR